MSRLCSGGAANSKICRPAADDARRLTPTPILSQAFESQATEFDGGGGGGPILPGFIIITPTEKGFCQVTFDADGQSTVVQPHIPVDLAFERAFTANRIYPQLKVVFHRYFEPAND